MSASQNTKQRTGNESRLALSFITFLPESNYVPIPFTSYVRQSSRHSRVCEFVMHSAPTAAPPIAAPCFSRSSSFSKGRRPLELSNDSIRFAKHNPERSILAHKVSFCAGEVAKDRWHRSSASRLPYTRKGRNEVFVWQQLAFRAPAVMYVGCDVNMQARDVM